RLKDRRHDKTQRLEASTRKNGHESRTLMHQRLIGPCLNSPCNRFSTVLPMPSLCIEVSALFTQRVENFRALKQRRVHGWRLAGIVALVRAALARQQADRRLCQTMYCGFRASFSVLR